MDGNLSDGGSEAYLNRVVFVSFRYGVAVVCMALAAMLSAQAYISLMDRIDHAHHHAHFANPLAGDIEFGHASQAYHHDGHHHDGHHHDGHGSQKVADHHEHGLLGHSHPHDPADHQHGDASIVFLAAQSFVLAACPFPVLRCDTASAKLVSFHPRGPDHPPKLGLEIRV